MCADIVTVILWELSLAGIAGLAFYKDKRAFFNRHLQPWLQKARKLLSDKDQTTGHNTLTMTLNFTMTASAEVIRGERSMNIVNGTCATILAGSYTVISSAACIEGWQATCMAFNTVLLVHLFYFNSWWRNRILFPLSERIRND